jgi:hypothetical protein
VTARQPGTVVLDLLLSLDQLNQLDRWPGWTGGPAGLLLDRLDRLGLVTLVLGPLTLSSHPLGQLGLGCRWAINPG